MGRRSVVVEEITIVLPSRKALPLEVLSHWADGVSQVTSYQKAASREDLLRDHLAHGVEPGSPGLVQSPWSIGDPRE